MNLSWAVDLTPNPGTPRLGSSLVSRVISPAPFKPRLKISWWAPPAHSQVSFFPFETVGLHLSPAGLVPCKPPHGQRNQNFTDGTKSLSHLLIEWVFLSLSVFFSATDGIGENTTLCPWSFHQSPQCPQVPLDGLETSLQSYNYQPALPTVSNNLFLNYEICLWTSSFCCDSCIT